MIPATVLGLAALAAGLAWLKSAISRNDGTAKRIGLIALLGSLLFLYPVADYLWQGVMGLPVSDVTSAPDDAPQFVALAKLRRPGENPAAFDGARRIRFEGEDVTVAYAFHVWKNGLITHPHTPLLPNARDPQATMFWRSFNAVKGLGWHIMDTDEKQGPYRGHRPKPVVRPDRRCGGAGAPGGLSGRARRRAGAEPAWRQ